MLAIVVVLLVVAIALLVALLVMVYKRGRIEAADIEPAVFRAWRESGLGESVGQLSTYARTIQDTHRSVEQMLRAPAGRGELGELGLETVLSDQLPPEMFGIREQVLPGKVPDAHVRSTVGTICIDSKFPLDNYRELVASQRSGDEQQFRRALSRDVRGHLNKIAEDYVCPDQGSAEFAFAYIPSEAVYYHLLTEEYSLLREFTAKGVQVVSPLTLSHKIELIKTGAHAFKLSREAARVRDDLVVLARRFEEIDANWRVLYRSHIRNVTNKASDLDESYSRLRDEFDRINRLGEDRPD